MSESHIKTWQTKIGVTVDGDFGPQTLAQSLKVAEKAGVGISHADTVPASQTSWVNPYYVKDHFLFKDGQQVSFKASPNHGGAISPRLIVIHYTGDNGTGGLTWLTQSGSGVSAHLWIAKTGVVWQLLPFNLRGWHAGPSYYSGEGLTTNDVNSWSIGIENQGMGDSWPEAQIQANIGVIKALKKTYNIIDIVGHDEVATPAGRKADPGPQYPWGRIEIR